MKEIKKNGFITLEPSFGKFIATKDLKSVCEGKVYLGKYDKPSNYVEVDKKTRDEILARIEEENKQYDRTNI